MLARRFRRSYQQNITEISAKYFRIRFLISLMADVASGQQPASDTKSIKQALESKGVDPQ